MHPALPSLYMYHLSGGSGLQLTGHEDAATPAGAAAAPPSNFVGAAFGPDPRYLWVAASSGGRWGAWQVSLFDRESGETFARTNELQSGMRPVVSPDGRWLAFATKQSGSWDLALIDLQSNEFVKLTDGIVEDWDPSFHPSGRLLVFARHTGTEPFLVGICPFGER